MNVLTMGETVAAIDAAIDSGQFMQHCVVNVAKLVSMRTDATLREAVNSCDIVNIDGMGVVWGARLFGIAVPERIAGIDLFYRLLALSEKRGYGVFLLGATADVVAETAVRVKSRHPNLVLSGFHHGYFQEQQTTVVRQIRESGAKLLFVALSSPLKEKFIAQWHSELGVNFVMGVGGTFDVVAGKVRRAPFWMQRAGMEWLFRLAQEPGRMWQRYLSTNLAYALLLISACGSSLCRAIKNQGTKRS